MLLSCTSSVVSCSIQFLLPVALLIINQHLTTTSSSISPLLFVHPVHRRRSRTRIMMVRRNPLEEQGEKIMMMAQQQQQQQQQQRQQVDGDDYNDGGGGSSCCDNDNDNDNDDVDTTNTRTPPRRKRQTLNDQLDLTNGGGSISVKPIGIVSSVYKLCVGTPRQGLLVPHARGYIDLHNPPLDYHVVDGLNGYSHIWIVFLFHHNTIGKRIPHKISPPALIANNNANKDDDDGANGANNKKNNNNKQKQKKVGVFATRSPHRFNPLGLSLVKLDNIEVINGSGAVVRIHISGHDLVDGTPVLDIKPYVPIYDAPTTATTMPQAIMNNVNNDNDNDNDNNQHNDPLCKNCSVPNWVSNGLEKRRDVVITDEAMSELQTITNTGALQFYDNAQDIVACIQEVLAVDVRSSFQTKKEMKGKHHVENSTTLKSKTTKTTSKPPPRRYDDDDDDKIGISGNGTTTEDGESTLESSSSGSSSSTQQLDNLLIHYTAVSTNNNNNKTATATEAETSATGNYYDDDDDNVVGTVTVTMIELLQERLSL